MARAGRTLTVSTRVVSRAVVLRTAVPRIAVLVVALTAALVVMVIFNAGCSGGSSEKTQKTSIRVLFAGSLIIPFGQLEREFEAAHPGIDVEMEGHGSIQVIRHVSDLHEQADVLVTADYTLIPMLLYKVNDPDSGLPYAGWYTIFATNEMTLAYTPESAFATEVNADNWVDIITRPGVRLGCADPRLDANGYRALMMVKLAEDFYQKPGLFAEVFGGKFRVPIRVSQTGGVTVVKVPEVLEVKSGSSLVMRPYSVQLLPLLESGDIDYTFEYTSVARQHGMRYLSLAPEVNLSDPAYAGTYDDVTVKLDFQRFASVKPEFPGESIRYGATIPSNAREPEAAATFLAYLLGPEGQRIMAENYQPMITPALADHLDAMPEPIKALCTPSD
jgi:molybdate/tungstate transport system substrate-binding protein